MRKLLLEGGEEDNLFYLVVGCLAAQLSASTWKKENTPNELVNLAEEISRKNFISCL